MNTGDIVMIYSDPVNFQGPEGWANLIKKYAGDYNELECWHVEFLDQPGKVYPRLIKKS